MTKIQTFTLTAASLLCATLAAAQAPPPAENPDEVRPAMTSAGGDTGLWYVPSADMVPAKKWAVSGYHTGFNPSQGFTNVENFSGTFAYGLVRNAELFGAFNVDTRMKRGIRPLFTTNPDVGGPAMAVPFTKASWNGNNLGDFTVGLKAALVSERYGKHTYSFAVRGAFKLPTASTDSGAGTGKLDTDLQGVVSSDLNKKVEVSAFAGVKFRPDPAGITLPNSFTWGAGAEFPSHNPLRVTAEVMGDVPSSSTMTLTPLTGVDGSQSLATYNVPTLTQATFGLTYQTKSGVFFGWGATWNFPTKDRVGLSTGDTDVFGDFVDFWQVRVGYHPGARQFAPPPPPPVAAAAPAPAPAPPVHNLTVRLAANPTMVQVGGTSTLTATAQDSTNCAVTYRYTAPAGTFANAAAAQTVWTAPNQDGGVPVTVTVTCPTDNKTATDSVTIQVARPAAVVELNFEDVYFDFDRSTLRPEALRLLDDAVARLAANPTRNIVIEGHTCNIGTAEYNLALGERRAASVRNYLASRGVAAARMETRSYGEEMPKFDNAREETRRLNRRAALVVRVQ